MMNKNNRLISAWSWREGIVLLLIVLVIIPILIEGYLQDFLYQVLQNSLYSGTLTGAILAFIFTMCVYLIALKPHKLGWKAVGLCLFPRTYWKWIVWWLFVLIVLSIGILTLMEVLQINWENDKTDALQTNMNAFGIIIAFISVAIISPIYEEIFYRGFLYKWLRMKSNVTISLLVSSTIFTIVHIPTYNTLPVNFLSGFIFAWTYEKTKSVVPAIIIHATYNGIAMIMTLIA